MTSELLARRLARERTAREEAERLLESKSAELWEALERQRAVSRQLEETAGSLRREMERRERIERIIRDRGEILEMVCRRERLDVILAELETRMVRSCAEQFALRVLPHETSGPRAHDAEGSARSTVEWPASLRAWARGHGMTAGWMLDLRVGTAADGGTLAVAVPGIQELGAEAGERVRITRMIAALVIEQHDLVEALDSQANFDSLTGLANRLNARRFLQRLLDQCDEGGAEAAVMLVDLDGFKPINDAHGHAAGDYVLVEVARRLRGCLRTSDLVARLGGDEFLVVLPGGGGRPGRAKVASNLLNALSEPMTFRGQPLNVSASVGVAVHPAHGRDVDALLRAADQAMYTVKRRGRNGFAVFGEAPHTHGERASSSRAHARR